LILPTLIELLIYKNNIDLNLSCLNTLTISNISSIFWLSRAYENWISPLYFM